LLTQADENKLLREEIQNLKSELVKKLEDEALLKEVVQGLRIALERRSNK